MFDQLKNIAKLKEMQDQMKKETIQAQQDGVIITINGNFDIIDIKLNPELSIDNQQKAILKAFDKAKQEIQKTMVSKLGGMF
jgi:DNA-binding protein YbaB